MKLSPKCDESNASAQFSCSKNELIESSSYRRVLFRRIGTLKKMQQLLIFLTVMTKFKQNV